MLYETKVQHLHYNERLKIFLQRKRAFCILKLHPLLDL